MIDSLSSVKLLRLSLIFFCNNKFCLLAITTYFGCLFIHSNQFKQSVSSVGARERTRNLHTEEMNICKNEQLTSNKLPDLLSTMSCNNACGYAYLHALRNDEIKIRYNCAWWNFINFFFFSIQPFTVLLYNTRYSGIEEN